MASTYTPLATTTLGSGVSSYTFSSISSAYTDLVLIVNGSATSGTGVYLRFNGDTSSIYSQTTLFTYTGGGVVSDQTTNSSLISLTNMYGTQMIATAQIMNYSNTNTYKTAIARRGDTYQHEGTLTGLWRSTSAINSLTILADVAFNSGMSLSLYGIKAK